MDSSAFRQSLLLCEAIVSRSGNRNAYIDVRKTTPFIAIKRQWHLFLKSVNCVVTRLNPVMDTLTARVCYAQFSLLYPLDPAMRYLGMSISGNVMSFNFIAWLVG